MFAAHGNGASIFNAIIPQPSLMEIMFVSDDNLKVAAAGVYREFLELGIPARDISVARLATELGVSQDRIYRYYNDANEILIALLLEIEAESKNRSEAWYALDGRSPLARLEDSIRTRVEYIRPYGRVLKAIVEASGQNSTLSLMWNKLLNYYIAKARKNIESQQASGDIRPELDALAAASYLTRGNTQIYVTHFGGKQQSPVEEVSHILMQIWSSVLYLS